MRNRILPLIQPLIRTGAICVGIPVRAGCAAMRTFLNAVSLAENACVVEFK